MEYHDKQNGVPRRPSSKVSDDPYSLLRTKRRKPEITLGPCSSIEGPMYPARDRDKNCEKHFSDNFLVTYLLELETSLDPCMHPAKGTHAMCVCTRARALARRMRCRRNHEEFGDDGSSFPGGFPLSCPDRKYFPHRTRLGLGICRIGNRGGRYRAGGQRAADTAIDGSVSRLGVAWLGTAPYVP